MIKDSYPLLTEPMQRMYRFKSVGTKGVVDKIIIFQKIAGTRYNLSFGDFKNGRIDDEVITNNGDLVKVISTVAQSVYLFFEHYPDASIEIEGVDERRKRLYNTIFQRRRTEIDAYFDVKGWSGGEFITLQEGYFYEKFVIQKKNLNLQDLIIQ